MQSPSFVSLAIIACLQISLGLSEDSTSQTNSEALPEASLSRAKREGSDDLARYGRGLSMLRLGKRDFAPLFPYSTDYEDALYLLTHGDTANDRLVIEPEDLDEGYTEDTDEEEPEELSHGRFRRSTVTLNNPAPVEATNPATQATKESAVTGELKTDTGVETFSNFPDENVYLFHKDDKNDDEVELPEFDENDEEKRSLGMLRLGKRQLSMLRLGKKSYDTDEIEPSLEEDKRNLGMLRLGKRQLSMLRLGKRSGLSMLRLGKRQDEDFDDTLDDSEDEEIIENDQNDDLDLEPLEKRPMGMLRLGKRPMSMLRLGKRPMSMLRLGKRPMSMLRLGKRPMGMLRLGKRPMSMLRLGKRSMSMLRLGKRPMGMLRLGKRPMGMLRLGKRPMGMLRLGKRPMGMLRLGKRPMSMLRLGKRPMSMLRLGKREEEDKRSLGMLRLGKRSTR